MRSTVIVSWCPRTLRYEITIVQKNGRHLTGLDGGGSEDHAAAARAAMYSACHCLPNPQGGDVMGPKAVLDLIPSHLRNVPPASQRKE